MTRQSTNHLMMLEPVDFRENPETRDTNAYQHKDDKSAADINAKAVKEFRAFRDTLIDHGVIVTTVKGQKGCPDDIFCNNIVSTHDQRRMVIYPMLAENRAKERRADVLDTIRKSYTDVLDFSPHRQHGKALESTGALCMDRLNKIAYMARSARSDEELAKLWCKTMGYTLLPFDTEHKGKPVYHTDVVMWIGTGIAGICADVVKDKGVLTSLRKHREVIEFTPAQMEAFCGNALEVVGTEGHRMLVMSAAGAKALTAAQKKILGTHFKTIIEADIPTIEYYGGGSARCMLLELF